MRERRNILRRKITPYIAVSIFMHVTQNKLHTKSSARLQTETEKVVRHTKNKGTMRETLFTEKLDNW